MKLLPCLICTCLVFCLACRIGSEGTFTQGHFDSKDNFAYQIIGQKQWTIYPPTDFDNLYFVPNKGVLEWSQALKSETPPDTKQFPLYTKTHPLSFTLNEGEVLYLPRGWIHTVKNLSPSLMINVWRRGPAAITAPWIEENAREIKRLCSAWVLSHSKFMYLCTYDCHLLHSVCEHHCKTCFNFVHRNSCNSNTLNWNHHLYVFNYAIASWYSCVQQSCLLCEEK